MADLIVVLPLYLANASMLYVWRKKLFGKIQERLDIPISEKFLGKRRTVFGAMWIMLVTLAGYLAIGKGPLVLPGLFMLAAIYLNCFAKRQLGMKEGSSPFPPFDQLDFFAGGVFGLCLGGIYISDLLLLSVLTFFLHLGGNMLAYKLGLKDVWW